MLPEKMELSVSFLLRLGMEIQTFHPQILVPDALCAAICSFVCRVRTSLRDGLIG